MKVLMATDGSRHASTALISAGRLLKKEGLEVDVLCVAPALATVTPGPIRDTYTDGVRRQSKRIVHDAQGLLRAEGIHAGTVVKLGSPLDDIAQFAANYDLVVVGAHGKHERRQPGLGPVSNHIVQHTPGTVMVGRDLVNDKVYRVLVALDGSDASFDALRGLENHFDVSSLDVTLMHVIELPWTRLEPGEDEEEPPGVKDYQREMEVELRRYADKVVDLGLRHLEKWGVAGTTIIEQGDPALELASHADEGNYDLVVVGATGSSDVKHALLGSVSVKLAWNSPCSVMVVRA